MPVQIMTDYDRGNVLASDDSKQQKRKQMNEDSVFRFTVTVLAAHITAINSPPVPVKASDGKTQYSKAKLFRENIPRIYPRADCFKIVFLLNS